VPGDPPTPHGDVIEAVSGAKVDALRQDAIRLAPKKIRARLVARLRHFTTYMATNRYLVKRTGAPRGLNAQRERIPRHSRRRTRTPGPIDCTREPPCSSRKDCPLPTLIDATVTSTSPTPGQRPTYRLRSDGLRTCSP
jgi:hypothetical protein